MKNIFLITLHEGCRFDGCWLEKEWLMTDEDKVRLFIDRYRMDKEEQILPDTSYIISSDFSDIQFLKYKKIEIIQDIPVMHKRGIHQHYQIEDQIEDQKE